MKKLIFCLAFLFSSVFTYCQTKSCPIVFYADNYKGKTTITREELEGLKKLEAKNDCDGSISYKIVIYEITMIINSQPISFTSSSDVFPIEVKASAKKMKSGSKIFFDNISVKDPKGVIKGVAGITLIIK